VNSCSFDIDNSETELLSQAQHCQVLLYFWINWEAANFCVSNRLRTPFGKPHCTFRAIEGNKNKCLIFLFIITIIIKILLRWNKILGTRYNFSTE